MRAIPAAMGRGSTVDSKWIAREWNFSILRNVAPHAALAY
jgi:hypothetical protein